MEGSQHDSQFRYRAFISYSHRDKAWADWLHKALETYRVPSRLVGTRTAQGTIPSRLNPIFRDREELASATDLGRKVNEALAQSENQIVICSQDSAASRWVNEEVLTYKRLGRAERILCLIVGGEPNATDLPGRSAEECFCPALRFRLDANGQPTAERTEPIAADARPGKDRKQNAKLKLIAGMLDVGFDALKQREQRRQIRKLTAIAAMALAVTAVTIVLAVFALIARDAAQRRQKQAEDMVGFMLGDLNAKLEQMKRLDLIQAVDDKAVAYFAALPATDVNDTTLELRAKALEKIGNVRMESGNLTGALEAFHASAQFSSRLASAQPANVARQVAYSRILAFSGTVHWSQGDLTAAQDDFETARQVLQPSLQRAPDALPVLEQLAYLDNDIGFVLEARGRPDAARAAQLERLELDQRLVAAKPNDVAYASDLGGAYNLLGKLALSSGDLAGAIADYRADDAIETRLSRADPKNNNQRDSMLESRAMLGRTLALTGAVPEAMNDLQQAVDTASQLVKFDANVHDFQTDLALYSSQLARLKRANGELAAARALSTTAVAGFAALTAKAPEDATLRRFAAMAAIEQAAEMLASGQADAATGPARGALRILEPMLAKHPDQRDTLLPTLQARLLLAAVTTDPRSATAMREQALRSMQAVKADRGDPRLLALEVEALLALDRKPDAQPLIRQLWSAGYRDPEFVAMMKRTQIDYPDNPPSQARPQSKVP